MMDIEFVRSRFIKHFDGQTGKYALGEKVSKDDLKLNIYAVSSDAALYDKIAKADKTFNKDKARLLSYDIGLSSDTCNRFKLKDGIQLTIRYPSDMAKDWSKYNYKIYHFVNFDYDKLIYLETPKMEEVKCTADKNGMHFKAPSFSNYVISVTPKSGTDSPGTGESSVTLNIVILVILFSTAGISGVLAKRKGELY